MCSQWRSIGQLAGDVTERAILKAMRQDGAGVDIHPLNVPPPQSAHRDALRFDSGRPRREEGTGRPPMQRLEVPAAIEFGTDRDCRRLDEISSPGQWVVETSTAGSPDHCLPTTGREKTLVFAQPPAEPAPGSASVFSLIVVAVHSCAHLSTATRTHMPVPNNQQPAQNRYNSDPSLTASRQYANVAPA